MNKVSVIPGIYYDRRSKEFVEVIDSGVGNPVGYLKEKGVVLVEISNNKLYELELSPGRYQFLI
jgi:hypothetical protein